ncbi:MAG: urea carboxylase-associated protein [Sphingomonas bacterium]|nr:urea carboxylase-associated protein [Sphingomonas bacterium]
MPPVTIPPRSGTAFRLAAGEVLIVIDPQGMQVADLIAFNADDIGEALSSGRTLDYQETIRLTTGARLWSNRSRVMLEIVEDSIGLHDFLLTPCSRETFAICYDDHDPHPGCFGNLCAALAPYGVAPDSIGNAFNCFMNVPVDGETGRLKVLPPISKAGDHIAFRAAMDLVIGLTACSARDSNGGSFKPIDYRIEQATDAERQAMIMACLAHG